MSTSSKSYEGVALVAPVSIPYERKSEHTAQWFIGRALNELINVAGLQKDDVDGLAVSSFTMGADTTISLTSYFSMSPRWIEFIPTGGSSGILSMRRAARAVQAGDADIVACIAGDTMNDNTFRNLINNFSAFSTDAVYPYGAGGPNAVFSMITKHYMEKYGAEREDFGRICIAQRENALVASRSLFSKPLSMEEYIGARPIADPLRLFDCVMPCAGAEGFLVMSVERAKALGLPYVSILSSAERHNAFYEDDIHYRGGWDLYREQLYKDAGVTPEDIDFFQSYDDYPVIVMLQLEDLGFCRKGEAAQFIKNTVLTWNGGGLPHNTCGGQLSAGQAGAAGGFLGIVEAIRQLVSSELPNAVPNATIGLVSGYGMVVYDRCLSTAAAILKRAE